MWLVLQDVAENLLNYHFRCMVADNRNVVFILRVGRRKPELHAIALKVISLEVHVDQQAVYLSRIVEPHGFCRARRSICGPHTVDWFAICHNRQTLI